MKKVCFSFGSFGEYNDFFPSRVTNASAPNEAFSPLADGGITDQLLGSSP